MSEAVGVQLAAMQQVEQHAELLWRGAELVADSLVVASEGVASDSASTPLGQRSIHNAVDTRLRLLLLCRNERCHTQPHRVNPGVVSPLAHSSQGG